MVIYNIVSKDVDFASMLQTEILSFRANCICTVNDTNKTLNEPCIIIVDLDSYKDIQRSDSKRIIGFSRYEEELDKSLIDACDTVLHRPFLIESFLQLILEYDNSFEGENSKSTIGENETKRIILNPKEKTCFFEGRNIYLSENEFSLLKALYDSKDIPLSREKLSETLTSSKGNMTDVYICHLRKKLEQGTGKKIIYTVRNKGYILKI